MPVCCPAAGRNLVMPCRLAGVMQCRLPICCAYMAVVAWDGKIWCFGGYNVGNLLFPQVPCLICNLNHFLGSRLIRSSFMTGEADGGTQARDCTAPCRPCWGHEVVLDLRTAGEWRHAGLPIAFLHEGVHLSPNPPCAGWLASSQGRGHNNQGCTKNAPHYITVVGLTSQVLLGCNAGDRHVNCCGPTN